MSDLRRAAEQALEALSCGDTVFYPQTKVAIAALRAALAQPDVNAELVEALRRIKTLSPYSNEVNDAHAIAHAALDKAEVSK